MYIILQLQTASESEWRDPVQKFSAATTSTSLALATELSRTLPYQIPVTVVARTQVNPEAEMPV